MAWRGEVAITDRLFGALSYLIPVAAGIGFAIPLLTQFPILGLFLVPIMPLIQLWNSPILGFILFLALYMLVVRNERINHFVRFNVMQAIMLNIVLILCSIGVSFILQPLAGGLGETGSLVLETFSNTVFLGVIIVFVYGVAQSLMGKYAEIPSLSDMVYMQVR